MNKDMMRVAAGVIAMQADPILGHTAQAREAFSRSRMSAPGEGKKRKNKAQKKARMTSRKNAK